MTDNSAEREAEKILEDAARMIESEQCPQGEECPVHHRVNEEYVEEESEYARYITYSGDYAVVTEDNHVFSSPLYLLKLVLGKADDKLPPRWETSVYRVGDGTLNDLTEAPEGERHTALRYVQTHDDWDSIQAFHDVVVSSLEAGLIDVSKPFKLED